MDLLSFSAEVADYSAQKRLRTSYWNKYAWTVLEPGASIARLPFSLMVYD